MKSNSRLLFFLSSVQKRREKKETTKLFFDAKTNEYVLREKRKETKTPDGVGALFLFYSPQGKKKNKPNCMITTYTLYSVVFKELRRRKKSSNDNLLA